MGRTSDARERLVESACDLLHARGYAALGVAEICAAAGVRKGSFYYFFPSKQALTVEVVQTAWANQRSTWVNALSDDVPPIQRLERLLASQAAAQRELKSAVGTVRGCLFGNLAQEMDQDSDVAAAVTDVFDDQITLVTETLNAAARAGGLDPAKAARDTAQAILAQLEGSALFAKLANDPTILDNTWPAVQRLLGLTSAQGVPSR